MSDSIKVIHLDPEFAAGWPQHADTMMRNLADKINVEMRKNAPYANLADYPHGLGKGNTPGDLVRSLTVNKLGNAEYEISSDLPYAIRRNFENNLHPETKNYIERSADNVAKGNVSQWWRAS